SQDKSGEKDSSAPRHNFVDVGGSVGMTESRGGRQDPLFYSILSFFLAFFAGGFPHIISLNPLQIEPYLPWWTETFVLTRSTILPHYLMGNIFFLLILILFLKFSSQKRVSLKSYVLYLISGFLLAFVHPIDFLILICSLGLFVVLQIFLGYCSRLKAENYRLDFSLRSKNIIVASIISTKYQILLLLLIFISGFLPALYYRYALSLPFWRFILAHGTTTAYNIPLFELGMALGPVFFLGIGGIIVYFFAIKTKIQSPTPMSKIQNPISKNKNAGLEIGHWPLEIGVGHWQIGLLLFSWLFAQTLFFLFLYQVFNFDRLRTMEAPFYLALAFFATYFIMSLRGVKRRSNLFPLFWLACPAQLLRSWVQNPSLSGPNRTGRFWSRFTPQNDDKKIATPRNNSRNLYAARNDIIVIVLIFLVTLPTSLINLHNQIYTVSDFKTFSLFSYPTVKQYQSWQFLRNHTPDNSAITSLYEAKFLIPTVSGNKIAFGANFDNNANYQNNVNKINQMYAGLLNPQDLRRFLKQNNISYVYWGYQEQSLGGNLTKYNFLQKVFDNGQVVVFAVK
ncbi:MAG: hypothetical protein M1120_03145, partial [Patescibacteria group bacterium]|nr:hypothetical protein [Patescibacteria group bacterium]